MAIAIIKTYNLTYAAENFHYKIYEYEDGSFASNINGNIWGLYEDYDSCKFWATSRIEELFF